MATKQTHIHTINSEEAETKLPAAAAARTKEHVAPTDMKGFLSPVGQVGGDRDAYVHAVEIRRQECNPQQE